MEHEGVWCKAQSEGHPTQGGFTLVETILVFF
jgi:hypothetical protein